VVVAPAEGDTVQEDRGEEARRLARELLSGGTQPSAAARIVSERLALARNEAYRIVHDLGEDITDG
jgi:hypothetical protein